MARSNVPKFGNWDNEDSVPYTVYFDKARKKKGERMINPNDPEENPDMYPNMPPAKPVRPTTPEHREAGLRQSSDSSARSSENGGRRTYNNKNNIMQSPARSVRPNAGLDHERSPLHPQYLAKATGRGGDGNLGNQIRSRLRPARGDESPEKRNAAVPKFGAWNDSDPQSANNFTHIFNQVRDERNTGGMGNPSATPKRRSSANRSQHSDQPKKCCFPWW